MLPKDIINTLIASIALAITVLFLWHYQPQHAPKPPSACSVNAPPCIELLSPGGQVVAKFNDFRFGDKGCVYYRSDVNITNWQQYCGGTMQWIGPNAAPKAQGG